jgi:hypothetical protein
VTVVGLHHFNIRVAANELAVLRAFYTDVVGLCIGPRSEHARRARQAALARDGEKRPEQVPVGMLCSHALLYGPCA